MLNRFHIFEKKNIGNFYYSLAEFDGGIPVQNLSSLTNEDRGLIEFNKNAYKHIIAYDFIIDIDSPTHKDLNYALTSARVIKKLFDECNFPYEIFFSGCGFHFKTEYKFFPSSYHFDFTKDGNIYAFFKSIAQKLEDKYSEMIDTSIYDMRRIIKLPFSLAIYENDVYVCKPINDLNTFDLEDYKHFDGVFKGKLFNPEGNVFKLLERLGLNHGTQKQTKQPEISILKEKTQGTEKTKFT